ncbi:hypothetical protein GGR50DRAFT_348385 [Xylaria sp. CBS 124048]|nr:hypothetical protein GGR50DRAFT_348385 [Xylaria sp. CBS 124048]
MRASYVIGFTLHERHPYRHPSTMVQTRRERKAAAEIKLAQPDRSGPSEKTLLDLALERNLFDQADQHPANRRKGGPGPRNGNGKDGDDDDAKLSPTAERVMETILWTVSLAMLHFTLDVLVQHQYAMDIVWHQIVTRSLLALVGKKCDARTRLPSCSRLCGQFFFAFFYVLHPHASSPVLVPGLPLRFQEPIRQAIFLIAGTISGCYLIHITNAYGYLYVMKRSPPLGCLWIWSIIELNLPWALLSLSVTGGYFYQGGYSLTA